MRAVRVFAPATVSNLGPGFDVLGLALPQPGDTVEAEPSDIPGVRIAEVTGDLGLLSTDPTTNVAGVAAASVLSALAPRRGVVLRVHKQMPLASGLGSSAASSVAGAMAVNELLGRPLPKAALLVHALAGEGVAAGTAHADNVAPCLLGGIVLARGGLPPETVPLPIPPALRVVVVHPRCRVETAQARALLAGRAFAVGPAVANLGNLGALVAALYRNDLELLGRCIEDRLVEPLRAPLVPGFAEMKEAARRAGALGCSISGSGPSVFALAEGDACAASAARAMAEALAEAAGLGFDTYVGAVNTAGAVRVD